MNREDEWVRLPLAKMVRLSGNQQLPLGWVYLPCGPISAETIVLHTLWEDYDEGDDDQLANRAAALGFPVEGLATDDIESIVEGVRNALTPDPSDDQLTEAFLYYWEYDAFLPAFGAPSPPSREETLRHMDREFLDKLGEEDLARPCREPECARGAVAMSVFCRAHHFEKVMKRPCPFE